MKKLKTMLALLLILALVLALAAGCASTSGEPTGSDSSSENTSGEIDTGAAEDEEATPIVFIMRDLRSRGEFSEAVEEKIHEIALEEANVDVDIQWVTFGDWQNKVMLTISSGEQVDVMHLGWNNNVTTMYAAGQLLDISEELQEYAPDAIQIMADYMGTYTFGDGVYGVPTNRNFCKNGYILMRKDILDELGLTEKAENLTSFTEYEEILAAVKENYTDIYPFGSPNGLANDFYIFNGDSFADVDVYDNLGGSMIYCKDDQVQIITDLDCYEEQCARVAKWMDNGWVWPDSVITQDTSDDVLRQGVAFSNTVGSEHGVEVTKSQAYGFDVVVAKFCDGMVKTGQPSSHGIGVPVTSEEPEAACKFINLLYTNSEIMNLLIWGIEGDDYTLEDGQIVLSDANDAYYEGDFLVGNNLLLTPLAGNGADFYEQVAEINATAVRSEYLGFAFDATDMDDVVSQISAVTDEYSKSIVAGGYTADGYAAYKEKLEVAGIRDFQAAYQTQLDAWLASK